MTNDLVHGRRQSHESDLHVALKSIAVDFLVGRGFDEGSISLEQWNGSGYVDVLAEQDSHRAVVECETTFHESRANLGQGAKLEHREGNTVFVLSEDGLYLVETEVVEDPIFKDIYGREYQRSDARTRRYTRFRHLYPLKELK